MQSKGVDRWVSSYDGLTFLLCQDLPGHFSHWVFFSAGQCRLTTPQPRVFPGPPSCICCRTAPGDDEAEPQVGPLRGIPFYTVPSCSVVGKPTDLLQLEPASASVDSHSNVNLRKIERAKQVIGLAGQRLDHGLRGRTTWLCSLRIVK